MTASKKYFSSTRIAMIALFSALAAILYIFNFALPFAFPAFLEFRFSDVPVLIGTFALGPVSGCVIVVMMVLIKLVCVSTSTMFVGDFADIIIGIAFCLPAGLIYKKRRTFKGAAAGLAANTTLTDEEEEALLLPDRSTEQKDALLSLCARMTLKMHRTFPAFLAQLTLPPGVEDVLILTCYEDEAITAQAERFREQGARVVCHLLEGGESHGE